MRHLRNYHGIANVFYVLFDLFIFKVNSPLTITPDLGTDTSLICPGSCREKSFKVQMC